MWEALEFQDENFLWTCIAFMGGISGNQQAPCGAVSASAVLLGLMHRCPLGEKQAAKQARLNIRQYADGLVTNFEDKFGSIVCRDLVGVNFKEPGGYQRFLESGIWREKCEMYVAFVIEKLYAMDEKRPTTS